MVLLTCSRRILSKRCPTSRHTLGTSLTPWVSGRDDCRMARRMILNCRMFIIKFFSQILVVRSSLVSTICIQFYRDLVGIFCKLLTPRCSFSSWLLPLISYFSKNGKENRQEEDCKVHHKWSCDEGVHNQYSQKDSWSVSNYPCYHQFILSNVHFIPLTFL